MGTKTGTDEVRGSEVARIEPEPEPESGKEGTGVRRKGAGNGGKGRRAAGGSKVMIRGECHCKMGIL